MRDRKTIIGRGVWGRMAVAAAGCAVAGLALSGCGDKPTPLTQDQQMEVGMANPQMQAVLDRLHKDGGTSFSKLTVAQARGGPTAAMAAMEVAKMQGKNPPEAVGGISNMGIRGRGGNNITLVKYMPIGNDPGPYPTLVFFHGGGFVVGSPLAGNPYDASCRALANMAHCVVVEVDYRLAPENPYPAAVDDCYDAFEYVVGHADQFKSNGKVAIAGESAGGNLAVAVPLMAIDMHTPLPCAIVSVYPVGGYYTDTPSARANFSAIPLDTPSLTWFYEKYVPNMADRSARYFDVDKADLHGLPPTTVITDQIDPLMSDGVMLKDALMAAGVSTRYMNYDGVTHEFFGMGAVVDKAEQAETFAVDGLNVGFGRTSGGMSNMNGMPGM